MRMALLCRRGWALAYGCRFRGSALLFEINVIPAQAGIYKPVSNGIMDTRLRGNDGRSAIVPDSSARKWGSKMV